MKKILVIVKKKYFLYLKEGVYYEKGIRKEFKKIFKKKS